MSALSLRRPHWAHMDLPQGHAPRLAEAAGDEWIAIHSNDIHTYQMECPAMDWIGIQCIGYHCKPMQFIPGQGALPTPARGKGQTSPGAVSLQFR